MVGYDDNNNALTLGDDDSIAVGDYELKYNSTDDEWHAEYGRPIGGETGSHGTIRGAEYTQNRQVGDYAMEFDERTYIDAPFNQPSATEFSVSAWFYPTSVDSMVTMAFAVFENNRDIQLYITPDGELIWGTFSSSSELNVGSIALNQWHHAVGTVDEATGEYELYLNGSSAGTLTDSTTFTPSNTDLIIGADADSANVGGLGNYFSGIIDDVRYYDRVVSSSEATDLSNKVDVQSGLIHHYEFEFPETPNVAIDSTGDPYPQNSVPRSTSGSLVPQGLAESVAAGEALADDGNTYSSVQDAVNAASGWVFVGPGTFNENVTIDTAGLTLQGSGYSTIIDGADSGSAINVTNSDCTVRDISAKTNSSSGNTAVSGGNSFSAYNVFIKESGSMGINTGSDPIIANCRAENTSNTAINSGLRGITVNCKAVGNSIGAGGDDALVANCVIKDASDRGMVVNTNDTVVISCRIINPSNDGIEIRSGATDNIVANNRISDVGNSGIDDQGTGTVLDGNLTGPSN